jgi:hypothetical protein
MDNAELDRLFPEPIELYDRLYSGADARNQINSQRKWSVLLRLLGIENERVTEWSNLP